MIDLRSLETFLWVARQQSFRAAASRLNTTQPAVSQRIAQLEATLGVALLHRTTRRVALTPKGRTLLDYAERLIALRAEMIAAVGDPATRAGTLRIGFAETIVHTWLPRLIERTAQVFPRLMLEIHVDITPNLSARLTSRDLDLVFMVGPSTEPGFQTRELCRYPVRFIASPKLSLPARVLAVDEIARHSIITFARNTRPYADLATVLARAATGRPRIHASASLATIVRMARDGLGIAAIPPVIVPEELARGHLREVRTSARLPDLAFIAAWLDAPDGDVLATVRDLAVEVAGAQIRPIAAGGRRKAAPIARAPTSRRRSSRGTSTA